jgi:predicted NBD/HSP70 family sugar kinase
VLAGAARGDGPAVAAVEHVADHLAIGLAAIVNTLNPRLIVLGGFFANLWPLTEHRIRRTLCQHALAAPTEHLHITPTLLGEDATLLGAAETALGPVVHDPTLIPTS